MKSPKRLIEVDLPIKKISEHARKEKSIRHGHISTLHIWWARRPLAACRAVICAALWLDPADPLCPERFKEDAASIMAHFWNPLGRTDMDFKEPLALRKALLDFIADFANWDNSTDQRYLETARNMTQSAHESLGGAPGTRPLVVDPFAGGGSIPLEALRVGADAFASDLNPVAVLLNKVVLEYIPKYGPRLADEVKKWSEWIKVEAEKELAEFYPKDSDGATPIAYLWARTITCEGPSCGTEVPLIRSLWLAKKGMRSVALKMNPDPEKKRVVFEIIQEAQIKDVCQGTVKRGSATCPVCGYTTPVSSVRRQLKARCGGAADARLFCVVTTRPGHQGRFYRLPIEQDLIAVRNAAKELKRRKDEHKGPLSLVPDEPTPQGGGSGAGRAFSQRNYGMDHFEDLFTPRQALMLLTFAKRVREIGEKFEMDNRDGLDIATQTILAIGVCKLADISNSLCLWKASMSQVIHIFTRQAIPMMWDFAECGPLSGAAGDYSVTMNNILRVLDHESKIHQTGQVENASANAHMLPDDAAQVFFTDPPYYDAIPYADLSDFFFVWFKRTIGGLYGDLLASDLTPKEQEFIVDEVKGKDSIYFETSMAQAMAEGRRVLVPRGIGIVVFAHKSTGGWEAMLQAMISSGWVFTGSWPIDTEMGNRLRAVNSAALASSIHLVCRPRENLDGSIRLDDVGDWRDVLAELPKRIHAWLPRLAKDGVVGADAIFSCLGPALEIYSSYSRVEKASGEPVTLREYLEEVWAAVSREALSTIFSGDTTGFEEDARLTAMWLWTLSAGINGNSNSTEYAESDDIIEEDIPNKIKLKGFVLEYDAARKITQGLGVHLENIPSIVEVRGDKARLLSVSERASFLLGQKTTTQVKHKESKTRQMTLAGEDTVTESKEDRVIGKDFTPGTTVLDRLHQAMILFSESRGEALSTFLQEMGQDQSLWSLGQAMAALYPQGSEERRWVEGVLARKKSLGI